MGSVPALTGLTGLTGLQWTPFGFRYRVADSMLEVSRERFQGTVLKAICRSPPKEPREEQEEAKQEGDVKEEEMVAKETQEEKGGTEVWKVEQLRRFWLEFWRQNVLFPCQQVKQEETEDGEQQEATGLTGRKEMQGEEEEQIVAPSPPAPEVGRLVMTVDGRQKQLSFGPNDLLSLATMLVGDKVRSGRVGTLSSGWRSNGLFPPAGPLQPGHAPPHQGGARHLH